ncbi:MAG: DUF58 domain-containing protein [Gemmataceae bacterium]|nr:DUF58 domain-containing protein [Gemmataceae bacterium]
MANSLTTVVPEVIELRPRTVVSSRLSGREGILWLLGAIVMLFIGILKGINLVIVLGYLLLGLCLLNWILARRSVRGLIARRMPRPPLQAGIPTEWVLEIRDAGPPTGSWVLEERVGEAVAFWLIVRAGFDQVARPRIRATFPRRGKFVLQPLIARSSFPFGLVSKRHVLLPADEIVVLPRPARVDGERLRAWLFRAWAGRDDERHKMRRVVECEAEVHGLRDYRAGDSPRRIHWKATARRNRLTVREYEDSAPPRLVLVVDPWIPKKPTVKDRERLEAVMSLAAGVCKDWRRSAGARLALVIAGPNPVALDGPPGPATTERLLIALAVEEGGEAGNVSAALGELSRVARSAPVLLLSSRPTSPVVASVGSTLGRGVAFAHVGQAETWYQFA